MKTSKLTKRGRIRIISYLVTLFVALGVTAAAGAVSANGYERQIELSRQRALNEFSENIEEMRTDLNKFIYANTAPMVSELSTSILQRSINAKTNLCQLPVHNIEMDNTYRFLSQVGDYLITINKKMANGESMTQDEHEHIVKFLKYADKLSEQVSVLTQGLNDRTLSFDDAQSTLADITDKDKISFSGTIAKTEEAFVDYPTLIYDGPFSDNVINRKAEFIKNKPEISEEEARKKVSEFFSININDIQKTDGVNGVLPCYCFQSDSKTISITRQGGYICYMINADYAGESNIDQEIAIEKAKQFLEKNGYQNMKESYYWAYDGVCVINFAQMQGDTICYADLIKVGISLDTGEVASFDARGYLMNHIERDIKEPAISKEQARQKLVSGLTVISDRMCIIPLESGTEVQCYEFHCKDKDDNEVLIYINCETGNEAQILMLLYQDGGVLTK